TPKPRLQVQGREFWFEFPFPPTAPITTPKTTQETSVNKRGKKLTENRLKIVDAMRENPSVSQAELVELVGIGPTNIEKNVRWLKNSGWIQRVGPARGGHWEV